MSDSIYNYGLDDNLNKVEPARERNPLVYDSVIDLAQSSVLQNTLTFNFLGSNSGTSSIRIVNGATCAIVQVQYGDGTRISIAEVMVFSQGKDDALHQTSETNANNNYGVHVNWNRNQTTPPTIGIDPRNSATLGTSTAYFFK